MVLMTPPSGKPVEVSETKAEQLASIFGWKYPKNPENGSEAVSEPETAKPATKRRGRPPKDTK